MRHTHARFQRLSRFTLFSLLATTAVVFSTTVPANPVRAAGDTDITVGDSNCDYTAAGLGSGTAQNPFKINSSKSLAEITDCRSRDFSVTAATVSGTRITFTANNSLAVGHSVTITGASPADFNLEAVRVVAASATDFTIEIPQTLSATYSSGGTASVDRDYYELTADIDLSTGTDSWNNVSSAGWTPIPLTKRISLNGKNKTINGLTITNGSNDIGLFAELEFSHIQNLKFTNVDVDQTGVSLVERAGALVGHGRDITLNNVSVQGSIIGNLTRVGLVAGRLLNSNVTKSSSSGTVTTSATTATPQHVGGLIGEHRFGNVLESTSSATVNGFAGSGTATVYADNVGGLAGTLIGNIDASSATGQVTGSRYTGGLLGEHCCGGVSDSFATGDVLAVTNKPNTDLEHVGGLIGLTCCGGVTGSYATGNVTAITRADGGHIANVGGLLGDNDCCAGTFNNYSTGNVVVTVEQTATARNVKNVGGSVGSWDCCGGDYNIKSTGSVTVVNNSSQGTVKYVGGYAGFISYEGIMERIVSEGNVSVTVASGGAAEAIGGFAGYNSGEFKFVDVHSSGNVTVNNGKKVGGLLGFSFGPTQIIDSSATGNVTVSFDGEAQVGGFIGELLRSSGNDRYRSQSILRSSATGTVSVTPFTAGQTASVVGGFIGDVNDSVMLQDVYVRSNVTGSTFVAGLFGTTRRSTVDATRVYVANTVSATGATPFIDAVSNGSLINVGQGNMFDQTLAGSLANIANFAGKTTAEMKSQATYVAAGFVFDGNSPVWKMSAAENGGYPQLVARPAPASSPASPSSPGAPQTIVVPATKPACVTPASLTLSFANGSSRLTAKAKRQIRSYVTKVKKSNCTQVNLNAYYVKNSPLAKSRNKVLVAALKNEFWRQQYVVKIRTSVKTTKSRSRLVSTVKFGVPR